MGFCSARIKGSMDIAWMYNQPFLLIQTMSTRSLAKQISPALKLRSKLKHPLSFVFWTFLPVAMWLHHLRNHYLGGSLFILCVVSEQESTCLSGIATSVFSYRLQTHAVSLVTFCQLVNYVFHCHDTTHTEVAPGKKGGFIVMYSQPEPESMVAGGGSG